MISGFIPLNKPAGISSQQAVSRVKRILGCKKAGHTGTLDPAATGLLLIALGKATRLSEYFLQSDKGYRAVVSFGLVTDTGDQEGEVLETAEDYFIPAKRILATLEQFRGRLLQRPPQASAIKINGQRAYKLFRQGLEPQIPMREIHIQSLEIVGQNIDISPANAKLTIDVVCSKGTYIRSLAVDIGKALDVPAHLFSLVRTRLDQISLSQAASFEDLEQDFRPFLMDMSIAVASLPRVDLGEGEAPLFMHGRTLNKDVPCGEIAVFAGGTLLGIARSEAGTIKPIKVLGGL